MPAPGRIRVGTVMADRGFFSKAVIEVLNDSGVTWLMPCPDTVYAKGPSRFRGWQARPRLGRGDHLVTGQAGEPVHHVDGTRARQAQKEGRGRMCGRGAVGKVHCVCYKLDPDIDVEAYCRRWGMETGYRQLESMRITTRSSHHGSRVMCMSMAIMLFNSWILVDALM